MIGGSITLNSIGHIIRFLIDCRNALIHCRYYKPRIEDGMISMEILSLDICIDYYSKLFEAQSSTPPLWLVD